MSTKIIIRNIAEELNKKDLKLFKTTAYHKSFNKKAEIFILAKTRGESKSRILEYKLPRGYKIRVDHHLYLHEFLEDDATLFNFLERLYYEGIICFDNLDKDTFLWWDKSELIFKKEVQ